jgi:uncharacterized protein (TIGR01777 family)
MRSGALLAAGHRMQPDPQAASRPLTIVVTGATGLIGSALVAHLRAEKHTVRRILHSPRAREAGDVVWDPMRTALPADALADADAVVHLAGEPVAHRWTEERKRNIRESRVRATEQLARAVCAVDVKPRVFLSGSAVGYYGDRGEEVLDETSSPGSDFLARVCVDWENATKPMVDAGVRVVLLRTGIVLSPRGGALARLLPIFRLGAGGPIGGGRQWMSWIGLSDHVRAMQHALATDTLTGPANLCAPNPVTNAEFATTLGRVLARPAIVPVPALALELLYGEMASATLLAGQRAIPKALSASGFTFTEPTLEGALRAEVRARA